MRISLPVFAASVVFSLAGCVPANTKQDQVTAVAATVSTQQANPGPQALAGEESEAIAEAGQPVLTGRPPAPDAALQAIPQLSELPPAVLPARQPAGLGETLRPTSFATLPGWSKDDLSQAWPAFMASCGVLAKRVDWHQVCSIARRLDAKDGKAMRQFFEQYFIPYQVFNADGSATGMVTGYYEPLLNGSRKRGGAYQVPLHGVPDDMLTIDLAGAHPELKGMRLRGRLEGNRIVPYYSRAELHRSGSLAGKELLWVDDPVEAFFLQVQGSGRVWLADSRETVRLAYADQNGHPYKSIGRYLIDRGELASHQASAQGIKAWAAANPSRLQELLHANPSYVFFKLERIADPKLGPKGAMGVPLTPQRSIAVDPQFIPLGAPVFLSTARADGDMPLQRLVLAQDTGSAIKNAVRADYFWGFGSQAGELAGRMKQRGMMWVLLPRNGGPQSAGR